MKDCSIFIADDIELFRRGLRTLLEAQGYDVAGEARSGSEVVAMAKNTPNSVLLLDASVAGLDSDDVMTHLGVETTDPKAVVLSEFFDEKQVMHAISSGARGYVAKDCEPAQLFAAIELVREGGMAFSDAVVKNLRSGVETAEDALTDRDQARLGITRREAQILQLLPTSKTLAQIATELYVSRKTVQNNVSSLYQKLGTHSRHGAVARATELLLIASSPRR